MLELRNVSKVYGAGTGRVVALDEVSLSVANGDFVAIIGPSGCGKSTLLNVIGGLERVSAGQVILDGSRIDALSEERLVDIRRKKIAYVFQQYHLIPSLTAWENVSLPVTLGGSTEANSDRAAQMLRIVGLEKRLDHKPIQLSGGEQQRVAIARALVNDCPLVLADEPTGNVDQKTGLEILDLFERLNTSGKTIVIVTHSLEIARRSKRRVTMLDGRVMSDN